MRMVLIYIRINYQIFLDFPTLPIINNKYIKLYNDLLINQISNNF